MSDTDYFGIDAVNWSTLKYMRESPMHYRHALAVPREDTPAFALGRVTHTLVFEPEKFEAEYVIWEGGKRQGKEWTAFRDDHPDQTIFKPGEIDTATAMAEAVRRHPLVQPYLDGGVFEQAIFWTDPETGLHCKGKPDWLLVSDRILLDLKTTVSAEARRFGAMAARYGYHLQMAHYRNGIEHGLRWAPRKVMIVAVEKDPPHDVSVFQIADDDLYLASEEVAELLNMVRVCRESGRWPGRYTEEQALLLPAWVTMDDEEDPAGMDLVIKEN